MMCNSCTMSLTFSFHLFNCVNIPIFIVCFRWVFYHLKFRVIGYPAYCFCKFLFMVDLSTKSFLFFHWKLIFNWAWFFNGNLLWPEWFSICFCMCPSSNITRTTLYVHVLMQGVCSSQTVYIQSPEPLKTSAWNFTFSQSTFIFFTKNPGGGKHFWHLLDSMAGTFFFFPSPPFV